MLILGIESSCDETAAAVVEMGDGIRKIHSNIVASQVDTHALYGGVVPEIASRAHIEAIDSVVSRAVTESGFQLDDIEAIGVTFAPGLIGSLLVGVSYAKSLAYAAGKPLVPVNHVKGHAAAAYLENPELGSDFLALIVSGGHTSLYDVRDNVNFTEIGASRDDAAGEAFDKVGRVMGLPYPGGAAMDRYASIGMNTGSELRFPSPAIPDDTLDFSFSGLKTAVINHIHNTRQKMALGDKDALPAESVAEIAAAFTESVVDGICRKLKTALSAHGSKSLVLAGGVAANSHLRSGIKKICDDAEVSLYLPSLKLCGDNAAMIAAQAYFEYIHGITADISLNAYASDDAAENAFPM